MVVVLKSLTVLEFYTKALVSDLIRLRVALKCSSKRETTEVGMDIWELIILFYFCEFFRISVIELKKKNPASLSPARRISCSREGWDMPFTLHLKASLEGKEATPLSSFPK